MRARRLRAVACSAASWFPGNAFVPSGTTVARWRRRVAARPLAEALAAVTGTAAIRVQRLRQLAAARTCAPDPPCRRIGNANGRSPRSVDAVGPNSARAIARRSFGDAGSLSGVRSLRCAAAYSDAWHAATVRHVCLAACRASSRARASSGPRPRSSRCAGRTKCTCASTRRTPFSGTSLPASERTISSPRGRHRPRRGSG